MNYLMFPRVNKHLKIDTDHLLENIFCLLFDEVSFLQGQNKRLVIMSICRLIDVLALQSRGEKDQGSSR